MSEKGPFDAAIAVLKTELDCSPEEEDEACNFIHSLTDGQYEGGIRAGLRVLEVAGKVDKEYSLNYMGQVGKYFTFEPAELDADIYVGIRALLESLPEKED